MLKQFPDLDKIIKATTMETLKRVVPEHLQKPVVQILKEVATVIIPKTFPLKTEQLSGDTKQFHEKLYRGYVEAFNLISSKLDNINKDDANKPTNSEFRRLKLDEQVNFNALKLHELYFSNISDVRSEIAADSTVFMRFSRDWGNFNNWQLEFRACGLAAKEGWAIVVYDPYKSRYYNVIVEGNEYGIPVGTVPVLVMDTHHHAWFKDYPGDDKINYLNAMMREINWSVVEARMVLAEKSGLSNFFGIMPIYNTSSSQLLNNTIPSAPPIKGDQIVK